MNEDQKNQDYKINKMNIMNKINPIIWNYLMDECVFTIEESYEWNNCN